MHNIHVSVPANAKLKKLWREYQKKLKEADQARKAFRNEEDKFRSWIHRQLPSF